MAYTAKLLARSVVTVTPSSTVYEAARLMKANKIGCVVVVDGKMIAGIFTERDLLNRVVAEDWNPRETQVSKVMTTQVVSLDCAEPLEKVFEFLSRQRFRHLPVTEKGSLLGIISLTDLAGILREAFLEPKYLQYFVSSLENGRKS